MRKLIISLIMSVLLMLALVAPAFAIVHPVTPIGDAGAVAASGGSAGGAAALEVVKNNPSNGPPMPAQGAAHAQVP